MSFRTTINHLSKLTPANVRQFYFRRVKEGCECPKPCPKDDKIVQEKKCHPCSFINWKPKPRKEKRVCGNMSEHQTNQPRKCCAAMNVKKPPPDCKIEDFDPFKHKCCIHQKEPAKKPPVPKKQEKPMPFADWDSDCKS